jgi:hypothetical protein
MHYHAILTGLFGWPGTWGTGGNLVAWVLCGTAGFAWLHAKQKARHIQALAQSAQHHKELLAQAEKHHDDLKVQAARQHGQLMAQADANHQMLMSKVADAQVSAGAGGNPADQGLIADQPQADSPSGGGERVVPPAAITQKEFERRIHQMMRTSPHVFEEHIRRMMRREGGGGK